jgi:hypothetical protein
MRERWAIALVAAAVLVPAAHAQMGGGVSPPALTAVGTGFPVPGGARFVGSPQHLVSHGTLFLGTALFPDYLPEPVVVQAPPPQVVVVQQPAVAAASDTVKPGPLLIEWQGDRYVRVTGNENRSIPAQPDYFEGPIHRAATPSSRPEMPPAVLIFRDGTRRDVREYVIVGGVLYAGSDYWENGSWTKQIQVSSLDVPATLEANQQRGVKFILPTGPHEVVTRP